MIKFKEYILLKLGTGGIKITYAWFYITDAVSKELVYIYDLDWLTRKAMWQGGRDREILRSLINSINGHMPKSQEPTTPIWISHGGCELKH